MFTEDIRNQVMALSVRLGDKPAKVSIEIKGTANAVRLAEDLLASICRYGRNDQFELVCDAVETVAENLAWDGWAVFEILHDASEEKEFFRLHGFSTLGLYKRWSRYIQRVPRADWQFAGKRTVVLPLEDLWVIHMPPLLGGKKGHKKLISQLARYHKLTPDFQMAEMSEQRKRFTLDFDYYHKTKIIREWQLTKRWGWNHRSFSTDDTTKLHLFYRTITFSWALAVLREHILQELNRLLTRLGVEATIAWSGLPLPEEVLRVRKQMLDGELSFGEAWHRVEL